MGERWTWHGGGLHAALAHFGDGPWMDLSTGINPHGWSGAADLSVDWRRLPEEDDLAALEAAAAAHFGVEPRHVCAVPGSEIGLRLIASLIEGPASFVAPGYGTHAEVFAQASPVAIDDLAMADGRTLLLANPNNPDGRLLDPERLASLLDRRGDGWLLIDEAFADATPDASLVDRVGHHRLVLFRSFGKFFGLAGVRLGFVLGPPDLRTRIGAWPVSAAAIEIGRSAYTDLSWIIAMRAQVRADAAELDASLASCGLTATGACPLFRLIEVEDAAALFERLCRHFILTRPFDYDRRWLRIGLPADAAARGRLEAALRG